MVDALVVLDIGTDRHGPQFYATTFASYRHGLRIYAQHRLSLHTHSGGLAGYAA
jgi:hypothetical protein